MLFAGVTIVSLALGVAVTLVRDVCLGVSQGVGRMLLELSGKHHVDLGGLDAAAIHGFDIHPDLAEAESCRQAPQPLRRSTGRDQGSKEHVAADTRSRVKNSKTWVRHRLRNMPDDRV